MSDEAQSQESIVDSTYGNQSPQHRSPVPSPITDFASWHLPRKQWVREVQWAEQCRRLIRDGALADDQPVRYLTLPGNDLLDIHCVGEICQSTDRILRYLGFHSRLGQADNRARVSLAEQVVRNQVPIHDRSLIVNYDVLTLGSSKSLATYALKPFQSFDLVNLDVCDSFADRDHRSSHQAVRKILERQISTRRQSWLLFLTSGCDPGSIPDSDWSGYVEILNENIANQQFAEQLAGALGQQTDQLSNHLSLSMSDLARHATLAKLFSIGIGKWLVRCVSDNRWNVSMPSSACYRRGMYNHEHQDQIPDHPEMVSLVFRFDPIDETIQDSSSFGTLGGSISADPQPIVCGSEPALAIAMAGRLRQMRDLDDHFALDSESEVNMRYRDRTENLLRDRNYDIGAYRRFVGE